MPLTYCKTAKGVAEFQTRAHKLAPRLRHALILVDGKRTDAALRALITHQPAETIAWLLENDFIDVMTTATQPGRVPVVAAVAAPAVATRAVATSTASLALEPAVETRRRDALQMLAEQLGPDGDAVTRRVRQAGTLAELRSALSIAAQTLYTYRGRDVAVAFVGRFNDV